MIREALPEPLKTHFPCVAHVFLTVMGNYSDTPRAFIKYGCLHLLSKVEGPQTQDRCLFFGGGGWRGTVGSDWNRREAVDATVPRESGWKKTAAVFSHSYQPSSNYPVYWGKHNPSFSCVLAMLLAGFFKLLAWMLKGINSNIYLQN